MSHDQLREIIERADCGAAPPPPLQGGDLASRVRRIARRRDRIRHAAMTAAGAMTCVAVAVALLRWPSQPPAQRTHPVPFVDARLELAALEMDANLHQKTADALRHIAARDQAQRELRRLALMPDPSRRIDEARDRTARILLLEADRDWGDASQKARALEVYAEASRCFPETSAGRLAAERLKTHNTPS